MDIRDLNDDIARVKAELDHSKRARENIERSKIHIKSAIDDKRRTLDRTLEVARRAQLESEEAQKEFDEAVRRMQLADEQLHEITDKESMLANQLRDLTNELSRVATDSKSKNTENPDQARQHYYR